MGGSYKVHRFTGGNGALKKYMDLIIGRRSFFSLLKFEFVTVFCSWVPGILGLFLRSKLYPLILGYVGKGVIFGRNIVFRHPHKIRIGDGTIIDDNCVLDAKGDRNNGIALGRNCYIGRNTIIYTKDGDIRIGDETNIGHNNIIFSSNLVDIKEKVLIAAYSYIMSGGSYDYCSSIEFVHQDGYSRGPTIIEPDVWLGAKVVVGDGVRVGRGCVVGAGSVIIKDTPEGAIVVGVPGKVLKRRRE